MIKSVRKGSASYLILTVLEKAVDGYVAFEDFVYNPMLVGRDLKKSELAQAIKRLRDGEFITEEKIGDGKMVLKMTSIGRELIANPDDEKNWDGKWRIVIWDIPEQKRIIRNLFRRNLKKWGFKYLQNSVWVSKRDIYQKLNQYIKEVGIEKWVTVIEADKISSES